MLHIETGRYKRYDNNLKQYVRTPREQRTCFLFKCRTNKSERGKFDKILECRPDIQNMTQMKKVEHLFKRTNKNIIKEFGKFVYISLKTV